MTLSYSLNELILFLIALFAVFSPFACIGPYAVFTESFTRKTQRKIASRVAIFSSVVLIILAWAGDALLGYLGISIEALGAAGGLVLILSSLPMIMKGESPRKKVKPEDGIEDEGEYTDEGWETIVVTPLIFPLTVGAGSISLVITQASTAVTFIDKLAITGIICVHGLVILATYMFSVPLSSRLGGRGSAVITRIGGIILLSLAFIIFTNGLKVLLPGLA
ncbi:MAG: MarC family protein [Spirochaetales bacterium]|uniref:UPF0056 membrane protein n=1 Tax=Candidatus Thalassospirochaeta sargassi TaxID=3119039 RepID=A0AAJ1IHB5_9SPIO|nr:MarC family protein [Spirochaetales bacterium]